ncbi:Rieske (2Fe-2S) protein [Luedemannella helvata]|uniref:Cytochrome bc1 complex Rieske iron-sulfur subunit n=1 Tax=Luedemannella helvata TaxID=349315 RepID=A0ABN2L0U4_9ACTN
MDTHEAAGCAEGASRRSVLAAGALGAGALGMGALGIGALGGCAANDAGPAPAAGAAVGGHAPGDAPGRGRVLGPADAIPVGGGQVFVAEQVVVTRPAADTYHAFTAVCTHAGCLVANVSNGTINCACHGSSFDATTGGVVNPPAPAPLREVTVTVTDGQLVLA